MEGEGASGERVGILGGTFDPPHAGHLAAAVSSRRALALDRVLLVVANDPWQKVPRRAVTPAEDRWAMVVAAARGIEGLEASRLEIDRGGPSYTVETIEELRRDARARGVPPPKLYLVVGADLVRTLPTWERAEALRRLVTVAVASRPHCKEGEVPPGWRSCHIDGGGVDVSSSELRSRLQNGQPVNGLVPEAVMHCIRERSLYAVRR